MNFLDKIPAWLRHFLIVLAAAAVTAASTYFANHQDDFTLKDLLAAVVAAVVVQLGLVLTPFTSQYGVGSPPPPGEPEIQ